MAGGTASSLSPAPLAATPGRLWAAPLGPAPGREREREIWVKAVVPIAQSVASVALQTLFYEYRRPRGVKHTVGSIGFPFLPAGIQSHSCLQEYNPIPACRNGLGPQFAQKKIHLSLPWGATGARDVSCTSML